MGRRHWPAAVHPSMAVRYIRGRIRPIRRPRARGSVLEPHSHRCRQRRAPRVEEPSIRRLVPLRGSLTRTVSCSRSYFMWLCACQEESRRLYFWHPGILV